ncbi:MAG TPA: carboxypeptidase-like regulatory domain-containing protein [Acidobacteriaceae bacterium]|nr:carboxypeptidase-like regulatory domain-containing protein [Acidobacteriaceae bacterium]
MSFAGLFRITSVSLLAAHFTVYSCAQGTEALRQVELKVTDPSGTRVPNAEVVSASHSGPTFSTTTDGNGIARLLLGPDTYKIDVLAQGFSRKQTQVEVKPDATNAAMQISVALRVGESCPPCSFSVTPTAPDILTLPATLPLQIEQIALPEFRLAPVKFRRSMLRPRR